MTLRLCGGCAAIPTPQPIPPHPQPPQKKTQVLIDADAGGILHAAEFSPALHRTEWMAGAPKAELGDLMRVHDFDYLRRIEAVCARLPPSPYAIGHLDGDTAVSRESWEAALRAAGGVSQERGGERGLDFPGGWGGWVERTQSIDRCPWVLCFLSHIHHKRRSTNRRARRWTACCRGRTAMPSAPCARPVRFFWGASFVGDA